MLTCWVRIKAHMLCALFYADGRENELHLLSVRLIIYLLFRLHICSVRFLQRLFIICSNIWLFKWGMPTSWGTALIFSGCYVEICDPSLLKLMEGWSSSGSDVVLLLKGKSIGRTHKTFSADFFHRFWEILISLKNLFWQILTWGRIFPKTWFSRKR